MEFARLAFPGYQFLSLARMAESLSIPCFGEHLQSLAACGKVESDPASVSGFGQFHKGGGEENSEVCREKLPWDVSSHWNQGSCALFSLRSPVGSQESYVGKGQLFKERKNVRESWHWVRGDCTPCIKLVIPCGTCLLPAWVFLSYPPAFIPPINQNKMDWNDFWLWCLGVLRARDDWPQTESPGQRTDAPAQHP